MKGNCQKCKYFTSAECVPRSQEIGWPKCWKSTVTNFDRLISKSPEDLADWLDLLMPDKCPPTFKHVFTPECTFENGCRDCWLDWLKSEADK